MDLVTQVRRVPDLMDASSSLLSRSASAAISPYQPTSLSSSASPPGGGSVTALTTPPPSSHLGSSPQDNCLTSRRPLNSWNYGGPADPICSSSTSPTAAAAMAATAIGAGAYNLSPYASTFSSPSVVPGVGATAPTNMPHSVHKSPSSYTSFSAASDYMASTGCQQSAAAMSSLHTPHHPAHQLNGLNASGLPPSNNFFYRDMYGAAGNHHGSMHTTGSFYSATDYPLPPLTRFDSDPCGATYMSDGMGGGKCIPMLYT